MCGLTEMSFPNGKRSEWMRWATCCGGQCAPRALFRAKRASFLSVVQDLRARRSAGPASYLTRSNGERAVGGTAPGVAP